MKIQRYDIETFYHEGIWTTEETTADDGEFVLYSDVQSLEELNAGLIEAGEKLVDAYETDECLGIAVDAFANTIALAKADKETGCG